MDIREIEPGYAVSPQLAPEDMAEVARRGFRTVISNRPDQEVPPELRSAKLREAAEKEGLVFVENPIATRDDAFAAAERQSAALKSNPGPALAYCGSGTRSTYAWALGEAPDRSADELISAAGRAGYDLEPLRPALER